MANRAPEQQSHPGLLESEWADLDRSIDDRIEDISATGQAAEQLTATETPEQARERQLAAFKTDQEAAVSRSIRRVRTANSRTSRPVRR